MIRKHEDQYIFLIFESVISRYFSEIPSPGHIWIDEIDDGDDHYFYCMRMQSSDQMVQYRCWRTDCTSLHNWLTEQKYYLPCFHTCFDGHAQVLEHCWRTLVKHCVPSWSLQLSSHYPHLPFYASHGISCLVTNSCVFWRCPPQSP